MSDLLIAVLGGSTASALALFARSLTIPAEVRANDAAVRGLDDELALWISDRHYELSNTLRGTRNRMAAKGQNNAGALDNALAAAKRAALHEYRDQCRRLEAQVEAIRVREGWLHARWRGLWRKRFPRLNTPQEANPVLATWRRPSGEAGGAFVPVDDPTARSLAQTIADLRPTSP